MFDGSKDGDNRTGHGSHETTQYGPIVETNFDLRVNNLEDEADEYKAGGYADHDVGQDNISLPAVADRRSAIPQAVVLGGWLLVSLKDRENRYLEYTYQVRQESCSW
jgi:hypothetical protein